MFSVTCAGAVNANHGRPRGLNAAGVSGVWRNAFPPPQHMVSRPYLASRRFISLSRVARMRAPVAGMGWPSEMPEPLTLSFASTSASSCMPQPWRTARTWEAKASLSSTTSISSRLTLVFALSFSRAGTGPMPM